MFCEIAAIIDKVWLAPRSLRNLKHAGKKKTTTFREVWDNYYGPVESENP